MLVIHLIDFVQCRGGKVPSFLGKGPLRGFSILGASGALAIGYIHAGWTIGGEQWQMGHSEAIAASSVLSASAIYAYAKINRNPLFILTAGK